MLGLFLIVLFAGYIIYFSVSYKGNDTEIIVGQKREIKQIGERIQEVLETEKREKKQERLLNTAAREAHKLLKDKRFKQAEKKYLAIIKEDHKNLKAYQGLGLLYLEQGEYSGAAEVFEKVCSLDPTNDVSFNNLGMAYLNTKNFEKAVEAYEHSVALNNKIAHRFVNLALAAEKIGDIKKEVSALEHAGELDPKKEFYYKLLEIAEKSEDKTDVKKYLEKILQIDPDDAEAHRKFVRIN